MAIERAIEYAYDNLSRLREARYNPGVNVEAGNGDLLRRYEYTYDRAGNRRTEIMSVGGVADPTITYDYNGANQLTGDGTYTYEYDGNGNLRYKKLTGTPVETYTWNRANRLVTWDNGTPADLLNYAYDGLNNRISRWLGTTSPTVTKYLLDLQPGLSVVLAATEDTDVTRYVHGPMGIHAQEDPAGAWSWMLQDGLGSVRGVVDNSVAVDEVRLNDPLGNQVIASPYDYNATIYGFTGEPTETVNPLVHLRARDYNPALGVFTALDPLETHNRYAYVNGNPINRRDPSGLDEFCMPDLFAPEGMVCFSYGTQQQETQETEEERRRRCQDNPNGDGCEEWWDENDPKECGCSTNYHPMSSQPFRGGGLWPTAELDLVCNLDCWSGDSPLALIPSAFWFNLTLWRDVKTYFLPNNTGDFAGVFLHPRANFFTKSEIREIRRLLPPDAVPAPGTPIYDDDIGTLNRRYNQTGGGLIAVRQPNPNFTRADRMGTFVEEITHAAIFHSPLCPSVTRMMNELLAKAAKVLWMSASDIPSLAFRGNVEQDMEAVLRAVFDEPNTRAFPEGRCPDEGISSAGFTTLVSFGTLGCVDPMVASQLHQVGYALI